MKELVDKLVEAMKIGFEIAENYADYDEEYDSFGCSTISIDFDWARNKLDERIKQMYENIKNPTSGQEVGCITCGYTTCMCDQQ